MVPASSHSLWWPNGLAVHGHPVGPILDQNNHKALQWVCKNNQAIVVYAVIRVNLLDMESSGSSAGFLGIGTAGVLASQRMHLSVV